MKKVVKKAAPKKKAVIEKKTGEKYASKAMMAKHEKGESKKMRMMEGEIPMKRKAGSMSKYGDGGIKKSIAESLSDKSKTTSVAKMRKGGKSSCSCGKASCMMCGGVKKHQYGGFQTQMGKIMKSQGQNARRAGLTKKLDGMGLFEMSEMKVKPVRKGATGAELKAEGMALKKKGMALKKKGQNMRNGGKK